MTFQEVKGSLFDAPDGVYLAHCVSSDYALGRGIAKEFERRFLLKDRLKQRYPSYNGSSVGQCLLVDHVLNLVTKRDYWGKPTYNTLRAALISMRSVCEKSGIQQIAMPRIGCGLDRLNWEDVKNVIQDVFRDTEVDITVYNL